VSDASGRPQHDLKVSLSMLTLVRGGMGGSETYAHALTRQLSTVPGLQADAIVPESARGFSAGIPEVVVEKLRVGGSNRDRLAAVVRLTTGASSFRKRFAAAQIVHYPFTVPAPKPGKSQAFVQSLLDVQHLDLPQLFSKPELLYRKHFYEGFARRADAVVTISHFAKARMVDALGLEPERIHVAHLGVDTTAYLPNLGPREDFVLYPARGWPHKNHARLIEGVGQARATNPDLRLVLTGGGLDTLGDLPDWVDRQGLVSQEHLRHLYRTARALVFPSLYEGFGLPPLEAMASGCPVAVSNAGSLPEVVGDAAVLFDPEDPSAISAAILAAIDRTQELQSAGLEQVKKFTWEACRDVHLDAYHAALDQKR
jgi:glycosyltransferase involved in cell wall biosynthesis